MKSLLLVVAMGSLVLALGCRPRVEVTAPTEPITINLNVKIEHELRIKVENDVEALFDENEELFGEEE